MKSRAHIVPGIIAAVSLSAAVATSSPNLKDSPAMHVCGSFDVELAPQQADNPQAQAANLGRLSLQKQFHGGLAAIGKGEMLATQGANQSGAYVAIERVTGSLQGRNGSFVLVHSAVMNKGVPESWSIAVVPDSGTEQLAGLRGTMKITIENGKHFYDLDYTLPES